MPTPILARRTAEAGFVGVERFIGIPGTVGGGIYMNAGCHGAEFAEIVTEVTLMDPKGQGQTAVAQADLLQVSLGNIEGIVLEAKLGLGEESPRQAERPAVQAAPLAQGRHAVRSTVLRLAGCDAAI